MRTLLTFLVALWVLAAVGCGSPVRHYPKPLHSAGTALPIEVSVKHKPDQLVRGTVHHRRSRAGAYESTPMQLRGRQLWALLPTEDLPPGQTVEYYIDVQRDGELHALGSPGYPFVVKFLDREGMIVAGLRVQVQARDDRHPMRIVLVAGYEPIEEPVAVYRIPGVPGEVRAPMEPDGAGNYHVVIPPYGVRPGSWRYAVELSLNETAYRIPPRGFQSYVVRAAPPAGPPPHAAAGAKPHGHGK